MLPMYFTITIVDVGSTCPSTVDLLIKVSRNSEDYIEVLKKMENVQLSKEELFEMLTWCLQALQRHNRRNAEILEENKKILMQLRATTVVDIKAFDLFENAVQFGKYAELENKRFQDLRRVVVELLTIADNMIRNQREPHGTVNEKSQAN